jgi:hypothetical protein
MVTKTNAKRRDFSKKDQSVQPVRAKVAKPLYPPSAASLRHQLQNKNLNSVSPLKSTPLKKPFPRNKRISYAGA